MHIHTQVKVHKPCIWEHAPLVRKNITSNLLQVNVTETPQLHIFYAQTDQN